MTHLQFQTCVGKLVFVATCKQLCNLVLVVADVGRYTPAHILGLDEVNVYGCLETLVHHVTDVTHTRGETCGHRVRNLHQHIRCLVAVEVGIHGNAVEQTEVQADVQLAHLLPSQLVVACLGDIDGTFAIVVFAGTEESVEIVRTGT